MFVLVAMSTFAMAQVGGLYTVRCANLQDLNPDSNI